MPGFEHGGGDLGTWWSGNGLLVDRNSRILKPGTRLEQLANLGGAGPNVQPEGALNGAVAAVDTTDVGG